ncbi:MAG: hypothetical protein B7Z80_08255 [Rhodospirillales bacterium 20-64-7]|nr:MAG: hypothetical protein B7Z80_08255 [Rhodospirillales bacterium 20-64-7]
MVDENELKGGARELGGKAEEMLGNVTGDTKSQVEGQIDQMAGRAQRTFGAAADEVRGNVADQPLTALAVVAGIAFVAGFLLRR